MQLTVRDVSRILSIPEKSVYSLIKNKNLPAFQINRAYRFNKAEIVEWAMNNGYQLSPEFFVGHDTESGVETIPMLSTMLGKDTIFYNINGIDTPSVMKELIRRIEFIHDNEKQNILSALLAREMLGSTAIGKGIAIPHVRNPIVVNLKKSSIFLAFLREPIDFGALDGMKVDTLFLLLSTTTKLHLNILARLSYVLQQAEVIKLLQKKAPCDAIIHAIASAEQRINATKVSLGVAVQ
ncbi:MAG: PTS sugar transporter subunit IIA [Chitinivibrionales bacterium]|nr:PTS sugar transporter subunit IIA [Chitinivibrionales bacterium]